MAATTDSSEGDVPLFGPWNPGISSHLTPELWRMCTIFAAGNVFTTFEQAVELRDATGLPLTSLVAWRPERMVLHEVLVRVTSDYEVPDPPGADVPSLGVNFRKMTRAVMERLSPQMELDRRRIRTGARGDRASCGGRACDRLRSRP